MYEEDTTSTAQLRSVSTPVPPPERGPVRVVVLAGEQVGRKYQFDGDAVVGRSTEATVQVEDSQVSRQHARIYRDDKAFYIEDLGSRNGTMVNGKPVSARKALAFGDRIQLGPKTVLLFSHYDPIEEQIQHRQRLEAIGRLGTGLAHDFNNLLGAILSSMDYLDALPRESSLHDPEVAECLGDIRKAAHRASTLTGRLLGFARRRPPEHTTVALSAMCDEVVPLARRTFDRSIRIDCEADPDLVVIADRTELHQTLMNLCINARDAMPEGGKLKIRVRKATSDEIAHTPLSNDVDHALIMVADTGVGMDEETLRHAFDPFFSTKEGEVGAGLGLATAFESVRSHGGHMTVESALGHGTCFQIFLPLAAATREEARSTSRTQAVAPAEAPAARLLLADDEDIVRRSAGRLLRRAGHDVLFATNGREAVEAYQQADPRPDVVLLDLDMPEVDGEEAYRQLRALDPNVRVVFLSGYWDEEREEALRQAGARGFVRKPYESTTLRDAVSHALNAPDPANGQSDS